MAFSICTYNMHGLENGSSYLQSHINEFSVCCVQETWLHQWDLDKLNTLCDGFKCISVSSMNPEEMNLGGRPYGGLGIFFVSSLNVSLLGVSSNKRVQAVKFACVGFNVILFNVYLPCLSQSVDYFDDIAQCCGFIDFILQDHLDNATEVIIAGDFNGSLKSLFEHNGLLMVSDMLSHYNVKECDSLYEGDLKYTFRCVKRNVFTWIDHIFVTKRLYENIVHVSILDDGSNLSDHCILGICSNINFSTVSVTSSKLNVNQASFKYVWSDINKNKFYDMSALALLPLFDELIHSDVTNCQDQFCNNTIHKALIDCFVERVSNCLLHCSEHCRSNVLCSNKVPWSNELQDLKKCSINAHKIWVANGKPHFGDAFDLKQRSHYEYKRGIAAAKIRSKIIFSEKLLDCMCDKNSRGFWSTWRSRTCKSDNVSVHCLDKDNVFDAANAFAAKFESNFVKSRDNTNMYLQFIEQLNALPNDVIDFKIDTELVESSLHSINDSTCLDVAGLCKFHVLYAHEIVRVILAKLFSSCISHCYVPPFFTKVVFLPLVKDKSKDLQDVSNYRPIAIVPIFSKLFEACIAVYLCNFLDTHCNQLGFVHGGGCSRAIFSLRTVIQYFLNCRSPVFLCALDAEKAFDRVNHYGLLNVLISRGVPKLFILLFYSWFSTMSFCVRWGNALSYNYCIFSGVLQGNLLSPKFFNVYINNLLHELQNSGLGCSIFGCYFGAIFYADDIILVSSSLIALQHMINLCVTFGKCFGIKFNPIKSQCMAFHPTIVNFIPCTCLVIDNHKLEWVCKLRYLGVFLVNNSKCLFDVSAQIAKFYGSVHSVLVHCAGVNKEVILLEILKTKCAPVLFYGFDAMHVDNATRDVVSKAWNWAIRSVFNIKKRESTRLLFNYCNLLSASFKIDYLQLCCLCSLNTCVNNVLLQACAKIAKYNNYYIMLHNKYNIPDFANMMSAKKAVWGKFNDYCFGDG